MTTWIIISIVFDIFALAFIAYGIFNEQKLIDFEDRVIRSIAKKIYLRRRRKMIERKKDECKAIRALPSKGRQNRSQRTGKRVA